MDKPYGIVSNTLVLATLLVPVIIGMVTIAASAYGMGKHQDNTADPTLYRVSIAFFSVGLVIAIFSLSAWNQGNYLSQQCTYVLKRAADTCKTVSDAVTTSVKESIL